MKRVLQTLRSFLVIILLFVVNKNVFAQQTKDSLYLDSIFKRAVTLLQKNPEEATELSLKLKAKARELQVVSKVISANNFLAMVNFYQGKHKESRKFYFENERLALELDDHDILGTNYFNMSTSYFAEAKNLKTTEYCLKALKYLDKRDYVKVLTYQQLAEVYNEYLQHDKAVETLLKALAIFDKPDFFIQYIDANILKGKVLGALGKAYFSLGDLEKSLAYFSQAESLLLQIPDDFKKGTIYYERVIVYQHLSKYYLHVNKIKRALAYSLSSKRMVKLYNLNNIKSEVYLLLGEVYLTKNDLINAKICFDEVKENLKHIKNKNVEVALNRKMADVYVGKGKYDEALKLINDYIKDTDSITSQKNASVHSDMVISYENELRTSKINEQKLEIEKQNTALLKANQKYMFIFIGIGFVALVLLILFVVYRNKRLIRRQEIKHLRAQNELAKYSFIIEGEEKERVRLAQDLHDGLNNDLAAIKFLTTSIMKEEISGKELLMVKDILFDLDEVMLRIRSVSHDLAPPSLRRSDFIDALNLYCNEILNTKNIEFNITNSGNRLAVENNVETAIYRVLQELISNISKVNNGVSFIDITTNVENDEVKIKLKEDGNQLIKLNEESSTNLIFSSRLKFLKATFKTERVNELNHYFISFNQNKVIKKKAS